MPGSTEPFCLEVSTGIRRVEKEDFQIRNDDIRKSQRKRKISQNNRTTELVIVRQLFNFKLQLRRPIEAKQGPIINFYHI